MHDRSIAPPPGGVTPAPPPLGWLIPLLVCPVCRGALTYRSDDPDGRQGLLHHLAGACGEVYPVIDLIPRLLVGAHRAALVRAKASWFASDPRRRALARDWATATGEGRRDLVVGFDHEWSHFPRVGTDELRSVFERYFDLVPPLAFSERATVLDAGCGAGRWAYEVATRGPRVIAVDLGTSIELASANTSATGRVACVQADLHHLPLEPRVVDWAYTLGVLHHLGAPALALGQVARAVRRDGLVLVYVYYALDGRGPAYRATFRAADAARRVISRLPRRVVLAIATLIAGVVYFPLARAAALLGRLGLGSLARGLPLSFYSSSSFTVMRNDSLDRFGTRVERRYTRDAMVELMSSAGLGRVEIAPGAPYWHAVGVVGAG